MIACRFFGYIECLTKQYEFLENFVIFHLNIRQKRAPTNVIGVGASPFIDLIRQVPIMFCRHQVIVHGIFVMGLIAYETSQF